MADFIFLHHGDSATGNNQDWNVYLDKLKAAGRFEGGSAIGDGACHRKSGVVPAVTEHVAGYIRISAQNLADAATLLAGNPVYESGGTVEIRELPRT
jgi:hypothetical protein